MRIFVIFPAESRESVSIPNLTFAKFTKRPEKFLALHFANVIWKNNTAEVMGHDKTDKKLSILQRQ